MNICDPRVMPWSQLTSLVRKWPEIIEISVLLVDPGADYRWYDLVTHHEGVIWDLVVVTSKRTGDTTYDVYELSEAGHDRIAFEPRGHLIGDDDELFKKLFPDQAMEALL